MVAAVTLGDLGAQIIDGMTLEGRSVRFLIFACPVDGHDHHHIIPFHEDESMSLILSDGREMRIWQRVCGSTINDLSLSPSYCFQECCLDVLVEDGELIDADFD